MRALEILAAIGLDPASGAGHLSGARTPAAAGRLAVIHNRSHRIEAPSPGIPRRRFLTGRAAADLRWFTAPDTEMTDQNWADPMG